MPAAVAALIACQAKHAQLLIITPRSQEECMVSSKDMGQGCNLLMEVVMVDVCERQAIKQHRASVRVIETLYEVDNGGLAAA